MRIFVDVAMLVVLLTQMLPGKTGNLYHEIAGIALTLLFVIHHTLNRGWIGRLRKTTNLRSRVNLILDAALCVCVVGMATTGILMSRSLAPKFAVASLAHAIRPLHACFAYTGFMLISLHVGLHLQALIHKPWPFSKRATWILAVISMLAGIWGFVELEVWVKLTLGISFPKGDVSLTILAIEHIALAEPFVVLPQLQFGKQTAANHPKDPLS